MPNSFAPFTARSFMRFAYGVGSCRTPTFRTSVASLRYLYRVSTSNFGGGRKLNAHFCSSGRAGRMEQRIIGILALTTDPAAAAFPAETHPLSNRLTSSLDIIFR